MIALALLWALLDATPTQHEESITVSRSLVAVRVNDMGQKPVPDLTASDFTATIDGKTAQVLSARWVDSEEEDVNEATGGRLFVLFIQTDFTRSYRRTAGQMAFRRYAEQMIASLNPEDRVAVFSFDSHLKFRRDFTTPEDASKAIAEAMRIDHPPAPPEAAGSAALTPHLDRMEMKRTSSAEASLLVVGQALQQIEGPKTMIFIGWGLDSENVSTLVQKWPKGVIALQSAEVTMYAFNYANMNSDGARLLGRTASEAGGFQMSVANHPQQAVDRFVSASEGHYELELRVPPEVQRGEHALQVRVPKRNVHVLAPGTLFTN